MDVNVKSIFLSIGVVVPLMIEQGSGSIINIASVGAIRPRGGLVWYSASKGAVLTVGLPHMELENAHLTDPPGV